MRYVGRDYKNNYEYYLDDGCEDYSDSLGFIKMPKGYYLLLNSDRTHFFGINEDNAESSICCDKWKVYHWAKKHSQKVAA